MKKINGSSAVLRIVAAFLLAPTVLLGCDLELDDKDSRSVVAGFNATDLTISGQATSFEVNQEFSFGDGAVITAKYSDESTKTLSASDVSVSFFSETDKSYFTDFTNAKANDTVVVSIRYKSGSVTCECQYEVNITNAVKSIEIKSVDKSYIYNPGALDFAADNAIVDAFSYKVTATYEDGATNDNFAANCTFAAKSDKSGVIATYNDITAEYSFENVKNAVSAFTVASGTSIGESDCSTSWIPSENAEIPVGKTLVAKFHNKGSGAKQWNNFLVEFFIAGGSGMTLRADNFGWDYAGEGTASTDIAYEGITKTTTVTDWDAWNALVKDSDVVVTAENDGDKLTITCTSTTAGLEDWEQKYEIPFLTDTAKTGPINLHFNVDGSYLVFD